MPYGRRRRIIFGRDELNVLIIHVQIIEGFLDQVGILVAHVPELNCRDTHEHDPVARVAITCGLEPGVIGMPVNFLFERI